MKLLQPNFWKDNSLISYLLWPLTIITRLIIFIKKQTIQYEPTVPTICVGNIYLGGTGKTQLVIKINEILRKKYNIFVIKKNYKNQLDEQKLLIKYTNLILPKLRVDGVKQIERSNKNIAILDDGLQDKSLKYKLSIVCFSSLNGIGNGKLLPAGPLREDLSELKNYDAVFLNGKKNKYLINTIKKKNKKIKIFSGNYRLKNKKNFSSKSKYLVFCGIGTPQGFFNLLKENKIKIEKKIIFPDHFQYRISDIIKIKKLAKKNNLEIITTEKDFMKIKRFKNFKVNFTNVDLEIKQLSSFKKYLVSNL